MPKGTIPYLTPYSPSFTLHLAGDTWKAVNGVLMLSQAAAEELESLIKSGRGDITSQVKKVDEAAAKRKAEEYLASLKPAAHTGVLTSDNEAANRARAAHLAQTRETLTGSAAPQNIKTADADTPALKVTEVPSTPTPTPGKTSKGIVDALRAKADKAS